MNTDQTPCSVASDLGFHCLSVSHKNARLIRIRWNNIGSCADCSYCSLKSSHLEYYDKEKDTHQRIMSTHA